jgi:outer membrane protein OmpA-like peptidoglycan-associated protein
MIDRHNASRLVLPILVALAGCGSQPPAPDKGPSSYVALLPNADGTVGQVDVKQGASEVKLDKPMQAATLGGTATTPFTIDETRLQKDFGAALAARPPAPTDFVLRFEVDGQRLARESETVIPGVVASVKDHPSPEVLVTGYADHRELAAWNKIDNPGALPIGLVLVLASPAGPGPAPTHTVQQGETLAAIAAKYGQQRVQVVADRLKAAGVEARIISTAVRDEASEVRPAPSAESRTRRIDVTVR